MEKYISLRKAQQKKETEKTEILMEKGKDTFFAQSLTWRNTDIIKRPTKWSFERERKVNETSKQEEAKKEREQMERGWTKGGHKEEKKSF